MANQKMFQSVLKHHKYYKDADTFNNEGFPAYKRKGYERLREILFIGNIGNTFYVKEIDNMKNKIEDIEKLIGQLNPTKVADLIVSARNEGLFRTIPITALVMLRKKDPKEFKRIFNDVVITGNDLKDFIDINNSIYEGLGRAAKTAIQNWLKNVNQFYALKYRKQITDGIALSRPRVDEFPNSLILKYVYANKKMLTESDIEKIVNELPQVRAAELFKLRVSEGRYEEACDIAKEAKLPADLMLGLVGDLNNSYIWETIMRNMGLMQFIKYINKLSSIISEDKIIAFMKEKLTLDNIKKARIFPYRLFIAWLNVRSSRIKDALEDVINLYEKPGLLPESWLNKKWAICPDVSGSMTWEGASGGIKASYIAGFFSAILGKQLRVEEILKWDTDVYPMSINMKSIFNIYYSIDNASGGGTSMNAPIDYLLKRRIKKDIVVIITDSEHWWSIRGVKEAWTDYKKKVNSKAKLIVIEVAGYGTSQVNKEFAEKYDVYTVFGWTESVFKWMELKLIKDV